jgi:cobalt-precorrin-7 (C5)-methyltransferase
MEHKIIVAGIGPGSPSYVLPAAKQAIDGAGIIVGSKRALAAFAPAGAEQRVIDGDIGECLSYIKEKLDQGDIVVMVSGDPGFYSLLAAVRNEFSPERLTVIPGISSVQFAFARLGQVWQDARLVSFHGRTVTDADVAYAPGNKLGILTDSRNNPGKIAGVLLAHGWPKTSTVWLCENLSYDNERIEQTTLGRADSMEGFPHCVMVVMA